MEAFMPKGKVKFFNSSKGFGFIAPEDGSQDLFVHISGIQSGEELSENQEVEYDIGSGKKGPCAENVR